MTGNDNLTKESNGKLFFPVFLDLSGTKVVVAGAGCVASRRIRSLLDFAGQIIVIAPDVKEEIASLADQGLLTLIRRPFRPEDLEGAGMVLAASDDAEVNRKIAELCRKKGIPVNCSHEKELCDFYFPGIVRKESVVIGVTASGTDHKKAKKITDAIRGFAEKNF